MSLPNTQVTKINRISQINKAVNYQARLRTKEGVLAKDDTQKENQFRDMGEIIVTSQLNADQSKANKSYTNCSKCGYNHRDKSCTAREKQCNHCKKIGHFDKKCGIKAKKNAGMFFKLNSDE